MERLKVTLGGGALVYVTVESEDGPRMRQVARWLVAASSDGSLNKICTDAHADGPSGRDLESMRRGGKRGNMIVAATRTKRKGG